MEPSEVLAQRLARRSGTVDMGDGKEIYFRRPPEREQGRLMSIEGSGEDVKVTWFLGWDEVIKYVTGWKGYTAADLLGTEMAPADPVAWSPELWEELCGDDIDLMKKVADGMLAKLLEFRKQRSQVAKNSPPA